MESLSTLQLYEALLRGDASAMHLYIQQGVDVHTNLGDENVTFLHHAAHLGRPACMEVLIFHGLDANVKGREGETPLHHVDNPECIEVLLKHGADINARDNSGNTPLHKAVERKSYKCITMLLEKGADPSLRDEHGFSPLDGAIQSEDTTSMDLLVPRVDINEGDKDNYTALHTAASSGFVKGVVKLLQSGANVNSVGRAASTSNDKDIVKKLKRVACEGHPNQNQESMVGERGLRAIHLSVHDNNESCSKVLIAHGADVNVLDEIGLSPLHIAAFNKNVNLVKLLIGAGANINAVSDVGETPLTLGAKSDSLDCVRVLLKAGANPNIMSEFSPLGYAALNGSDQCIEILLKHGADANAKQKNGKSVLYLAANKAHFSCVRKLLVNGALL